MQKVQFILSTIFLVAAAKVLALSPQIGFGWHPHYNYTNNTNGSHHNPQYPSNRNHCMYQNIPEPGSHSVYVGCVNYTDRLLYSQIHAKGSLWFKGRKEVIRYPKSNGIIDFITAIRIRDMDTNGQGGYAQIRSGGVGSGFVEIKLSSPRGRGFRFQVNIYGH